MVFPSVQYFGREDER